MMLPATNYKAAKLRIPLQSMIYTGYVYKVGEAVTVIEPIQSNVFLIELAHPNDKLVGGFDYEVLEVFITDIEMEGDDDNG